MCFSKCCRKSCFFSFPVPISWFLESSQRFIFWYSRSKTFSGQLYTTEYPFDFNSTCCLLLHLKVTTDSVYWELFFSLYMYLNPGTFFFRTRGSLFALICNASFDDILNILVYNLIPSLYVLLSFLSLLG